MGGQNCVGSDLYNVEYCLTIGHAARQRRLDERVWDAVIRTARQHWTHVIEHLAGREVYADDNESQRQP